MELRRNLRRLLSFVTEAEVQYRPFTPSHFAVDYYVVTPRGSRTRFNRRVGLTQIRNARSETAVLYYLKSLHPGADVIIQNLVFN